MTQSPIPPAHAGAIDAALTATFGATPALTPLLGGASAQTFRFEHNNKPYVLRLDTHRDPIRNPARTYAAMQIAAAGGVAPAVHHADPFAGIAIMDFIEPKPITSYPGGPEGLVRGLGDLAARTRDLPAFPTLGDYMEMLQRMLGYVAASQVFAPGLLEPHLEALARIRAAYPWDPAAATAGHNDPNPRNILFDGQRLWLIDWETAFQTDPLIDVAILADSFAPTPELADRLLTAWTGHAPDVGLRARLTLMRRLARLWYAGLILTGFVAAPFKPGDDLSAMTPQEFTAAIVGGAMSPVGPETRYMLGKMMLLGFINGLDNPECEAALANAALV